VIVTELTFVLRSQTSYKAVPMVTSTLKRRALPITWDRAAS